jgi:hypothetical protein
VEDAIDAIAVAGIGSDAPGGCRMEANDHYLYRSDATHASCSRNRPLAAPCGRGSDAATEPRPKEAADAGGVTKLLSPFNSRASP